MDCVFCKIVNGEIPAKKVYEDDAVVAFHDLEPRANVHVLIIPKTHIASAADITEDNAMVVASIFKVVAKLSREMGMEEGFRVVTNGGRHGCQSVGHLHFHLLGGNQLSSKMC